MKDFLGNQNYVFILDCLTENDSGPESKIPRKDSKSKLDWCLPQQNHHHQHVEQG